jgi:hypothetical protein
MHLPSMLTDRIKASIGSERGVAWNGVFGCLALCKHITPHHTAFHFVTSSEPTCVYEADGVSLLLSCSLHALFEGDLLIVGGFEAWTRLAAGFLCELE